MYWGDNLKLKKNNENWDNLIKKHHWTEFPCLALAIRIRKKRVDSDVSCKNGNEKEGVGKGRENSLLQK